MYSRLLVTKIPGITSEIKYCFVKLRQCFPLDQPIDPNLLQESGDESMSEDVGDEDGDNWDGLENVKSDLLALIPGAVDIKESDDTKSDIEENDDRSVALLKGVKKLARALGVTDAVLKKTLEFLKETGCLTQEAIRASHGRYPSLYRWQSKKMEELYGVDGLTRQDPHITLIDHLLVADRGGKGGKGKKRHPLLISHRLLLSILLIHADSCGVVKGLGMADLCKLACMKRDRVESHIVKLLKEGYIRQYVPGLTGQMLFGCVKGVFFLNLRHANFKNHAYAGLTFLFREDVLFDEFEFQESKQVFRKSGYFRERFYSAGSCGIYVRRGADQKPSVIIFEDEKPVSEIQAKLPQISGFFREDSFLSESSYLQMKLEEYASYLLTHRWRELKRSTEFIDDEVMQRIQKETLAPKFLKHRVPGSFPSDEQINRLYHFIYFLSLNIAINIKTMIALNPKVVETPLSFCIVPHPFSNNGYAVEAFFKPMTLGKAVCLDLKNGISGRGFVKPSPRKESGMDLAERHFYGLQSPVNSDEGESVNRLNELNRQKRDKGKQDKTTE